MPPSSPSFIYYLLHFVSVWYQPKTITNSTKPRMVCLWPSLSHWVCVCVLYLLKYCVQCLHGHIYKSTVPLSILSSRIHTHKIERIITKQETNVSFPGTRLKFQSNKRNDVLLRCIVYIYIELIIVQPHMIQSQTLDYHIIFRWNGMRNMTFSNRLSEKIVSLCHRPLMSQNRKNCNLIWIEATVTKGLTQI